MNILRTLLVLVVGSLTSQQAQAQASTSSTHTLVSGGLVREYRLYVPPSYRPGHPAPLLFNLHGYTSNAQDQEFYGDFRAIADTAGFLLVHPNGTLDGYGNRYWNTFSVPGSGGPDDAAFLSDLLAALSQQYSVDASRVYSTGFSNGGFMSYELACRLGNRVAAVASVSGSLATARAAGCAPGRPTPVLEIHGTADTTVPYYGNAQFVAVPGVLSYWVQVNGDHATPTTTAVPDLDPSDGCTAEHLVWAGGRNGATVAHFRIVGGGHTWPGSAYTIGVTNHDIKASQEIWRFLRGYQLSELLPTAAPALPTATLRVYPNPAGEAATVQLTGPAALRPEQVRAYDALGRAVPVLASGRGELRLDVSAWPTGVYVLRLAGQPGALRLLR